MNLNYFSIPNFLVALVFFLLGSFVFLKNPRKLPNLVFAGLCTSSMVWQLFYALAYNAGSSNEAFALLKIGYIGVIFISAFFGHYFFIALKMEKKFNLYLKVIYLLGVISAILIQTTPFLVSGVYHYFWGFYPKKGLFHPLFLLFFIGNLNVGISIMAYFFFFKRKTINALTLNQFKYILLGFSIYTIACIDFLPNYGLEIYPFGYLAALLFVFILAFTIIRYRLMEIDTVVHRTALWLFTLVSLVIPMALIVALLKHWIVSLTLISTLSVVSVLLIFFVWYYNRLRPLIDHFFRRRKYDYQQVLGEIGERIGSELDISKMVTRLFRELKEILYIRNGLVFVQHLGEKDYRKIGRLSSDSAPETSSTTEEIEYTSPLSQWLREYRKALERGQVEIDPQYEPIKTEALSWFNEQNIEVLIPVIMENNVTGLIGLGKKENLQPYTGKDIELLEKMGRHLGVTFDNALHHGDIIEKERMDEELKLGREIQMNLLPKQVPTVPCLSLSGLMVPAKEIGGDYYDFVALPNKEEVAIVIGDVSGKGVGAGLLMSMTKATINAFSQEEISPKQILVRTNTFLYQQIEGQKFMTLLYFKWQPSSRTFRYSSAGHEHILVYHIGTGEVETIPSGGFMLGMLPEIESFLEEKEITFAAGDKILLYTDGVTDADNQQGKRFSLTRLQESFQRHSRKPAAELIVAVKDEVYGFIGNQPQYDDITLVAMEIQ